MKKPSQAMVNIFVFLTSFSILGYEIILTRIFAYTQWYNLSSLIITMALLGFGASGSVIAMIQERIEKQYSKYLFLAMMLFPIFLCAGFLVSAKLGFNPYDITFSTKQLVYILLYFFFMGIPFFFGAAIICISFLNYAISKTYFANLMGSAAGAIFVVGISFIRHPYEIMTIVIIISMVPLFLISSQGNIRHVTGSGMVAFLIFFTLFFSFSFLDLKKVSQYKSISGALNLPFAKIIHEAYSPLAVVQVVQAKGLRSTAGLSLRSPFQVPMQKGIFFNADSMSSITPEGRDDAGYVQYLTSYLPFHVIDRENRNHALIIGPGGGESILKALLSKFKKIDGVEADPTVIALMKNQFAPYSGNIYNLENVEILNFDARSFIKQTKKSYDLIEISMIDAYNAAASGVYSLNETYLYTVEAIKEYVDHLSDNGLLSISRWVVTPARDNLKMFNIVITALKNMGMDEAQDHLIAIRSLQTLTLLVSKKPVSMEMIRRTKTFSRERLFDLVYYPGINETEVNRFIKLETPVYYNGLKKLLSNGALSFIDNYTFDITAATDNMPYFYNFFKPKVIKLIRTYGPSQIPVTEWGYLILLVILVPVLLVSLILIPAPLLIIKKRQTRRSELAIFIYFSLTGMGFFFIEMPLIQKMTLFLGHPTYSISVMIAGLLVFAGIGSYFSDRLFPEDKRIIVSTVLIALITGLYLLFMDKLLGLFISYHIGFKIMIALFVTAPLGVFMGIPFPAGLGIIKKQNRFSVPWAWGINGFFSVISILFATLFAIIYGFRIVLVIAAFCYLTAGVVAHGQLRK